MEPRLLRFWYRLCNTSSMQLLLFHPKSASETISEEASMQTHIVYMQFLADYQCFPTWPLQIWWLWSSVSHHCSVRSPQPVDHQIDLSKCYKLVPILLGRKAVVRVTARVSCTWASAHMISQSSDPETRIPARRVPACRSCWRFIQFVEIRQCSED